MADEEVPAQLVSAVRSLLDTHPPAITDPIEFLRAQFDAGLAYVWFPHAHGGLDLPLELQRWVDERLLEAGAPPSGRVTNAIAAGQGAATIVAYGSEEQKRRYLRPLFTGELLGCQLYSEPGAGSDLASLSTSAVLDGDKWVVNGQKVWTSGARKAGMAILLARTDPDAPKHAGLTQFVLDMHAPGVEVRPLRQMDGGAEFSEVFLTDVRIPDTERLGDVNAGWAVARHTLVFERYNMPNIPSRGEGAIGACVATWRSRADKDSPSARVIRSELIRHWVDLEVLRLLQVRANALRTAGSSGPEGSVLKLATSLTGRRLAEWAPVLEGPSGSLLASGYGDDGNSEGAFLRPRWADGATRACLASPGMSIAGGTDQIQRNIIGERVLGLPREPVAAQVSRPS